MKNTVVISVSLSPEEIKLLDQWAAQVGSRSSAVRELIARRRKTERDRELDEAYRAYYADPVNRRDKQEWTRDMLRIASWPEDEHERRGKSGTKGRPTR